MAGIQLNLGIPLPEVRVQIPVPQPRVVIQVPVPGAEVHIGGGYPRLPGYGGFQGVPQPSLQQQNEAAYIVATQNMAASYQGQRISLADLHAGAVVGEGAVDFPMTPGINALPLVSDMQATLNRTGFRQGPVTGRFCREDAAALDNFQQAFPSIYAQRTGQGVPPFLDTNQSPPGYYDGNTHRALEFMVKGRVGP